ncbi:OTU deubiquitinase with linear linkage specificity a isoform X2 [Sebastes umbrosus]|uniref:OTU deubiquitinase with linear linkage specificity a isoform X2 n=1 Tax=Sebastes umbrosus TaxID=72105 RepID=UPI00189ECD06|nr:OTU deubiquitinase with linear linkage specificity a isoform X2 [Sebastes umbrosus]
MMSWVNAATKSEDVFDEDGDEFSLMEKDWASNKKKRTRDGFVDGADHGEDAALLPGFNIGFHEGAAQTVATGRLKGVVSAISCWCQIQHPESPVPASVTDLLQRVSKHEDAIREGIRRAMEDPPPSVSSVSESMEDLEVKPVDPGCCGGEGCKETDCCKKGEPGCCGGEGSKETDCCKKGENMDLPVSHQKQKLGSGSTDCSSSSSSESLSHLLQLCMDLVSELGLPQELIGHIQEMENM